MAADSKPDPTTKEPDKPSSAPAPNAKSVVLSVRYPHSSLDPGEGLDVVTTAGTAYTPKQADRVHEVAHRYNVPLHEATTDTPKEL